MFLKNCWQVAAWDHELLCRSDGGKVVALPDRCCHRGVPLQLGRREGAIGWRWPR